MNRKLEIVESKCDEIDLQELWKTLVKYKNLVIFFTLLFTIIAVGYVSTVKPLYKGSVLIEIGSIVMNSEASNDKPTIIQPLESTFDLREIIKVFGANELKDEIRVEVPQGSSKLVYFIYENSNKYEIKNKLQKCIAATITRHAEKAKFFKSANALIQPTILIESIKITPIKSKNGLIVVLGLISGLIFGVFIAFFTEYIQNGRKYCHHSEHI